MIREMSYTFIGVNPLEIVGEEALYFMSLNDRYKMFCLIVGYENGYKLQNEHMSTKKPLIYGPGVCFPISRMMTQYLCHHPWEREAHSNPSVRGF